MPNISAITKKNHADKSWTRFTSYTFASKDNLAPLRQKRRSGSSTGSRMLWVKRNFHQRMPLRDISWKSGKTLSAIFAIWVPWQNYGI
jgi:hypothetical protein